MVEAVSSVLAVCKFSLNLVDRLVVSLSTQSSATAWLVRVRTTAKSAAGAVLENAPKIVEVVIRHGLDQ